MKRKAHLDTPEGRRTFLALKRVAEAKGETIHHVGLRFALERYLQRIFETPDAGRVFFDPVSSVGLEPGIVVLKGGMVMTFAEDLPPLEGRSTGDADLHLTSFPGSMEVFAAILRSGLGGAPATGPDDGVRFDVEEVEVARDREERTGGTVTVPLQIGALVLKVKSDVTFDARPMHALAPVVQYPSVMPGTDLGSLRVRRVPFEFMMADKIGAAMQLGMGNYRLRDYYDMRVVLGRGRVDREVLASTLAATVRFKHLPMPDSVADLPGFSDAFADRQAGRWEHESKAKNYVTDESLPEIVAWLRSDLEPVFARAREIDPLPGWAFAKA